MEAYLVCCEEGPLDTHSPEGSSANLSIRVSAERASPVFELIELAWSLLDKELDRVLIGEKVASLYGIVGV
jgi:hypothetical protein